MAHGSCIKERCRFYNDESESSVLFDYQDTDGCRINYKGSQVQPEIDDVGGVVKQAPRGFGKLIDYLNKLEDEQVNDEWDAGYITAVRAIRQWVEREL